MRQNGDVAQTKARLARHSVLEQELPNDAYDNRQEE
jgi:hypothetical protein